jgi:hypothetical protein
LAVAAAFSLAPLLSSSNLQAVLRLRRQLHLRHNSSSSRMLRR